MKFFWGAATSSHQIEGGNFRNDWWDWEHQGKIDRTEVSGQATDHWNRFKEDLSIAKQIGLNAYRFSVEWSRIEPEEGVWDDSALDWYGELIGECERLAITPMMTLHHFTSPLWFSKQGGFSSPMASQKFSLFVKKIIRTIGNRVPHWCTFNEPIILCVGQHLGGFQPPALYNPEACSKTFRGLLESHVKAYDLIHSQMPSRRGPYRHQKLMVGYAHNMMDFLPARHWHPMERLLTFIARGFYNQSWLDATTGKRQQFGITGLVPFAAPVNEAIGRITTDFIGINYYSKALLRWRARGEQFESAPGLPFGVAFSENNEPVSEMGWGIHPAGLGRMIRFVKNYRLPIFITENGIADGKDQYRSQYLIQHLKEVAREMREGADIRGYYYWSLLDNFEWVKGFKPRFGLVEVNYETFKRTPRESSRVYADIIRLHQQGHQQPTLTSLECVQRNLLKLKEKNTSSHRSPGASSLTKS